MRRASAALAFLAFITFDVHERSPAFAQQQPNMDTHVKVGDLMPPVKVQQADGTSFDLAHLRGKVVVVNFWATWCGPCMVEMPHLEADVWSRYKANPGFAMVAIAREQDQSTVSAFQKSHPGITFPLAMDPHRTTYALFADAGIPRTYLVGRDGRVLFETLGGEPAELAKLEQALQKALAQ